MVNSGGIITPTGSTFNVPLFVPFNDVASLAAGNNVSFDQIEISSATLPSGNELDLDLIGTNTANLSYVFPNGFTVGSGANLVVGANVPVQIPPGETLTDDGTLSFASGDTLTLDGNCCSSAEIVVAGTLTAAGTTFTGTDGGGSIVVNSGGQLNATSSTFSLNQLVVESGSTANLQFVTFATQLAVNSGASIDVHNNDLSSANATVVASGSSTATIDLTNNFWGTLNTTQIAAKITDHTKNPSLPTVLYQPFLTEDATATYASNASAIYSPNAQTVTLERDRHQCGRSGHRRHRNVYDPEWLECHRHARHFQRRERCSQRRVHNSRRDSRRRLHDPGRFQRDSQPPGFLGQQPYTDHQ